MGNTRAARPPRVQVVSREMPSADTCGTRAYLLDVLRYLRREGMDLDLVLLDPMPAGAIPWFRIPTAVGRVSAVAAPGHRRFGPLLVRRASPREWALAPARFAYERLPSAFRRAANAARRPKRPSEAAAGASAFDAPASTAELEFVRRRFQAFQPDVLIVCRAWLSDVLDLVPAGLPVLRTILTQDVMCQRTAAFRQAGLEPDVGDWTREREAAFLRKAEVVLAIHDEDAELLRELAPCCTVVTMPISAVCQAAAGTPLPGRCLFVGSSAPHNTIGLRWFIREVWPRIREARPGASLHICGNVCDAVPEVAGGGIALRGKVPDLLPEFAAAEVCVVPTLAGSGLKIKLVDALAHGRAVVATSSGTQGLRDVEGEAVLVADTPVGFAAAVVSVLEDPARRRRMEDRARRYIAERLSPDACYQPFVSLIRHHISPGAAGAPR